MYTGTASQRPTVKSVPDFLKLFFHKKLYAIMFLYWYCVLIGAVEFKMLLFECSASQGVYSVMITSEYKPNNSTYTVFIWNHNHLLVYKGVDVCAYAYEN